MNWQVNYALKNIAETWKPSTANHVSGEFIRICTPHKPDVLAAISAAETVCEKLANQYHMEEPDLDFLCGYRQGCVWEGGAITYLQDNHIGWGNFGTLGSAVIDENANSATHKVFAFSDRLIRQFGLVAHDRVPASGVARHWPDGIGQAELISSLVPQAS